MKPFEEQDRYTYPLTQDSIVMDVGAHEGNWANIIQQRYGCTVHCYEPVPEFYNGCVRRFADNPRIRLWPFALGGSTRTERFGVKGTMSGAFCTTPNEVIEVAVLDVANTVPIFTSHVDLLKINAEGAEYEILERLLDADLMRSVDHLQVQPHTVVPDYENRWAAIRARLAATHQLTFDEPFCWTGFSLR